ncbi:MAG: HAD family phosphatase [Bacilli bacterium]|nr:HAD family phosphatase [Bacilli bacterium]
MKLGNHEINAVIFDMDGTLIDSTGIWHEIDKAFFAKRGMELPSDYAQHIVHLGLTQAAVYTKNTYHLEESIQDIMDEWHNMSINMYKYDVPLKPGALALLKLLKKNGIKMAIATANDEPLYKPCIERLGIGEYFDEIADVNSAKEGKQSAKIYLDLADKLGSEPRNTLVLEDMPTCVKTAFMSGFITVAVYDDASKAYNELKKIYSHEFINNFDELIKKLEY